MIEACRFDGIPIVMLIAWAQKEKMLEAEAAGPPVGEALRRGKLVSVVTELIG